MWAFWALDQATSSNRMEVGGISLHCLLPVGPVGQARPSPPCESHWLDHLHTQECYVLGWALFSHRTGGEVIGPGHLHLAALGGVGDIRLWGLCVT